MAEIPCFLCSTKLQQRTDKNRKPYFVCDTCGIQIFIRRRFGIERLDKYVRAFARGEITYDKHLESLADIEGVLSEIRGLKQEINQLDGEIGIIFPDRHKVAAKRALEKRLERLLTELESKAEGKNSKGGN